jgi:hypothetical protein
MGLFFIHVYSCLYFGLVSFTVLDCGLAAVGLDLVSFLGAKAPIGIVSVSESVSHEKV